ncbi:GTP-binding protein [Actinoplanes utahensis]|uniref:GTP-binding protein n=1 Tax=Actinoplanes utahensis TaxID=1869 RepID=UPI00399D6F38
MHEDLEELTEDALRGRGQLWITSQPDEAVAFEFAGGGVRLGRWLAALPAERWTETSDQRRLAADLDRDPYHGDRQTVLLLIGLHLDHTSTLVAAVPPADRRRARRRFRVVGEPARSVRRLLPLSDAIIEH